MQQFHGSDEYIASDELIRSVNIAAALKKPLLIKGEPGTGKTMLAEAIARSLDMELLIWNIKSTTRAQDGLYVYDTVQRLYDSQFGADGVDDIARYIRLGKMGEAFEKEKQTVLLIDEIDKADLEFPNDLLWELDKMEFYIPETGKTVKAKHRPIVIITSNAEKELPDAFLRRCIFHYIAFPEQPMMEKIIKAHYPDLDQKLIDGVLPYRLNEKKDFSMGYLSGFMAENRDMEKDSFVNEVKEEVRQFALSSLSSQTGNYSSVQIRKNQADITGETWATALLPVWTVTYNDKARGKIYYFALNGQTGKIWGELPVDQKKLAVLFLSIFIPACVILLFLGYWIG